MTDERLMFHIGEGDRAAYGLLVNRHLRSFMAFAARVTGDRMEAEDILQEAFVRVWKNASRWDQTRKARFTTWFYRIVLNLCIDVKRKRKPVSDLDDAFEVKAPGLLADAQLSDKQMAAKIGKAMTHLPERQKLAMTLCYLQGLGNKEAAEILDISIGAIESLLVRARAKMAELLKEHREEFLKEKI